MQKHRACNKHSLKPMTQIFPKHMEMRTLFLASRMEFSHPHLRLFIWYPGPKTAISGICAVIALYKFQWWVLKDVIYLQENPVHCRYSEHVAGSHLNVIWELKGRAGTWGRRGGWWVESSAMGNCQHEGSQLGPAVLLLQGPGNVQHLH